MTAIATLSPLTDHGGALIDKFERVTGELPVTVDRRTGDRTYYLGRGGLDSLDTMLDDLEPDWREHIARSATDG
jgi:hypothetical protein